MSTLLKEDVARLAMPSFLDLNDTELVLNSLLNVIQHHLQIPGNRLAIRGLGVFYTTVQPSYIGRNPKKGVKVRVPAKKRLRFVPSVTFFKLTGAEVEDHA